MEYPTSTDTITSQRTNRFQSQKCCCSRRRKSMSTQPMKMSFSRSRTRYRLKSRQLCCLPQTQALTHAMLSASRTQTAWFRGAQIPRASSKPKSRRYRKQANAQARTWKSQIYQLQRTTAQRMSLKAKFHIVLRKCSLRLAQSGAKIRERKANGKKKLIIIKSKKPLWRTSKIRVPGFILENDTLIMGHHTRHSSNRFKSSTSTTWWEVKTKSALRSKIQQAHRLRQLYWPRTTLRFSA